MLAEGSFGKVFMFLLAACCFNLPIAFVYCLLPIVYSDFQPIGISCEYFAHIIKERAHVFKRLTGFFQKGVA